LTCYADTSFVFSLYGSDGNSPAAVTEMESVTTCMLSELTLFEFENALATYRFRKDISLEDMDRCLKAFHEDVASGLLRVHPFPHEIFAQATALSREHTPRIGNRALDVLHVAIALLLGATVFYTFDDRQARLARAAGLSVRPRSRR
jgi:predicted nucleic acid-binding protein